jgi:hypothetical protein
VAAVSDSAFQHFSVWFFWPQIQLIRETLMPFGFGRSNLVLLLTLAFAVSAFAQSSLTFLPSPESAGRGGLYVSGDTDDPLAPLSNPGLAGFLAERNLLSASFNPTHASWMDMSEYYWDEGYSHAPRWKYASREINLGVSHEMLAQHIGWRVPLSVGLGYFETEYRLPDMWTFGPRGEQVIKSAEKVNGANLGLSYQGQVVQAGVGWAFKSIHLNSITGVANPTASDGGVFVQASPCKLFSDRSESGDWRPYMKPSVGYSIANVGGEFRFEGDARNTPLPRTSALTLGLAMGLRSTRIGGGMEVFGVQVGEQVTNDLVAYQAYNEHNYKGPFGDVQPFNDLVMGESHPQVGRNQGLELSLLELAYLRWGHVRTPRDSFGGWNQYSTSGYGLRLSGLLKLVGASTSGGLSKVANAVVKHVDVQYQYASSHHDGGFSPLTDGATYHQINLLWRQ